MGQKIHQHKHINLGYLDMMADGDSDIRTTMLRMLLDELPNEIAKMRRCLPNNCLELREVSHKMKSTLAFIGNEKMADANREIEKIAIGGSISNEISGLLSILEDNLPGVIDELKANL